MEAMTQNNIGHVYDASGEKQKALDKLQRRAEAGPRGAKSLVGGRCIGPSDGFLAGSEGVGNGRFLWKAGGEQVSANSHQHLAALKRKHSKAF